MQYILTEEEYELERDLFPELTFENSPQEVELKLIKNDKDR